MTNKELLAIPKDQLNQSDQQRQHTLLLASLEQSCPACQALVNVFTAAGIDINNFDFGKTQSSLICPYCNAHLEYVVSVISLGSPWRWELRQPWLREQLEKAKVWDKLQR